MSYQNKYLKYKNKYLDLKNKNQIGGSNLSDKIDRSIELHTEKFNEERLKESLKKLKKESQILNAALNPKITRSNNVEYPSYKLFSDKIIKTNKIEVKSIIQQSENNKAKSSASSESSKLDTLSDVSIISDVKPTDTECALIIEEFNKLYQEELNKCVNKVIDL